MLDALTIPAPVFDHFKRLGEFDYREATQSSYDEKPAPHLVDVEILGHIFEQSITDLERIQSEHAAGKFDAGHGVSRRKREGAFYTPDFVTRFIVGQALSRVLEEGFDLPQAGPQRGGDPDLSSLDLDQDRTGRQAPDRSREEVDLMWRTAPPRMPPGGPDRATDAAGAPGDPAS